jgi:hypothetical protein
MGRSALSAAWLGSRTSTRVVAVPVESVFVLRAHDGRDGDIAEKCGHAGTSIAEKVYRRGYPSGTSLARENPGNMIDGRP